MAKKIVKARAAATTPAQRANPVWLASLGALSLAQKRGGAALHVLVAEGADFQARARTFAREVGSDARSQLQGAIAPLRSQARTAVRGLGARVERTIAAILGSLGLPSKADVDALGQRMSALSRQLKTR